MILNAATVARARLQRLCAKFPPDRINGSGVLQLRVLLEPSDEGGYSVSVPALPGCVSEGETRDEALANIREAIELYLDPVDDDTALGGTAELVEIAI